MGNLLTQPAGLGRRLLHGAAIGLAVLVAPGCGTQSDASREWSRVAARVDGVEITRQQLEERMVETGAPPGADDAALRRRALDSLIDEQLLVQRAREAGLEHAFPVRNAIEKSRRRLLARAAVEELAPVNVSLREARSFYSANPELFENRKVYTFRRFELGQRALDARVKARLDAAGPSANVSAILRAAGIPHTQVTEVRPAESLPEALLPQASLMAAGDILLFRQPSGTVLMQLRAHYTEPIDFGDARPAIEAYLAGVKRARDAARLVTELRREARIELPTKGPRPPHSGELAGNDAGVGEPPSQNLLQSRQTTLVR